MSRARSVASLCSRLRAAAAAHPTLPGSLAAGAVVQGRPVVTAAAAGAAVSGTMMRVLGVDVPYAYVIGTALAVGVGAYAYETLVVAREDMRPLAEEWVRRPDIKSLQMTSQDGQTYTAQNLLGKWALVDFGSLSNTADVKGINAICRAAEAAQQRTGIAVTPVFVSLTPHRDRQVDLKRVVGAAGHPGLVALTGDADGVLECANKFKSQKKAAVLSGVKGDEQYKKGDMAMDESYVSSFVYLVNPSGEFAALWPKDVTTPLLSDAVSRAVKD
ncbi:hypothetical protein ABPG77_005953 [Micractinium sp. CCAP 211/92]